jgi:hypothetical protein
LSELEQRIRRALQAQADEVDDLVKEPAPRGPEGPRPIARFALAIAVVSSFVAVVGTALVLRTVSDQPASPGSGASSGDCPAPSFMPRFLPWLDDGDPVPAPEHVTEEGSTVLAWFEDGAREWRGPYVALRTSTQPLEKDLDGSEIVQVRGPDGQLVWVGDPGVGEVTIVWQEEEAGSCSWYSIHLSSAGMTEEEARATILRVADSLA